MRCISWNCQGLGNSRSIQNLREIIRSQRPSLIFLIETLVNDEKIEQLRIQLGFAGKFVVNRVGRGVVSLYFGSNK